MRQFRIVPTPQEALAQLSRNASAAAAAAPAGCRLSRLAKHLLGDDGAGQDAAPAAKPDTKSMLSSHVAQLLDKQS